jgi:hypothetical protein
MRPALRALAALAAALAAARSEGAGECAGAVAGECAAEYGDEDEAAAEGVRLGDAEHAARFGAFRFELALSAVPAGGSAEELLGALRAKADRLYCLGWAQVAQVGLVAQPRRTVVGEARCGRRAARLLRRWLTERSSGARLLDYADAKIKLAFPRFELLEPTRVTCFSEPPHKCERELELEQQLTDPAIIWGSGNKP